MNDFIFSIVSNNAGIMAPPFMHSKDNMELQFATNYLGTNIIIFYRKIPI